MHKAPTIAAVFIIAFPQFFRLLYNIKETCNILYSLVGFLTEGVEALLPLTSPALSVYVLIDCDKFRATTQHL